MALDQLLPEIVEDHRHLTRGKDLALVLETMPACHIVAPLSIVQAAIGNLLRNAIENSDRGEIRIRLHERRNRGDRRPGSRHVARGNQRDLCANGARRWRATAAASAWS